MNARNFVSAGLLMVATIVLGGCAVYVPSSRVVVAEPPPTVVVDIPAGYPPCNPGRVCTYTYAPPPIGVPPAVYIPPTLIWVPRYRHDHRDHHRHDGRDRSPPPPPPAASAPPRRWR